eukprot:7495593-Lingulodinium_polyedra.AAC.1
MRVATGKAACTMRNAFHVRTMAVSKRKHALLAAVSNGKRVSKTVSKCHYVANSSLKRPPPPSKRRSYRMN